MVHVDTVVIHLLHYEKIVFQTKEMDASSLVNNFNTNNFAWPLTKLSTYNLGTELKQAYFPCWYRYFKSVLLNPQGVVFMQLTYGHIKLCKAIFIHLNRFVDGKWQINKDNNTCSCIIHVIGAYFAFTIFLWCLFIEHIAH